MRSPQVDSRCRAVLFGLSPAIGTQAPAIARFQAGEAELGPRCDQVIAALTGKSEEGFGDTSAHRVRATVVSAGVTAAVAKKAGDGIGTAGLERLAKDVQ